MIFKSEFVRLLSNKRRNAAKIEPYFDREFYLRENPDVAAAGIDPVVHYLDHGWREDRDPGPEFRARFYARRHLPRGSDLCPLVHYADKGAAAGLATRRDPSEHPLPFRGFSIGGVDWMTDDLEDVASPAERLERLGHVAGEDARLTAALEGNLLRVFYSHISLIHGAAASPTGTDDLPRSVEMDAIWYINLQWYVLSLEDQVRYLALLKPALDAQLAAVRAAAPNGDGLFFDDLDAYVQGVRRFNEGREPAKRIRVLLTRVGAPPRPIVECPHRSVIEAHVDDADFDYDALLELYNTIHAELAARILTRYASHPDLDGVVCAYELNNEPDYEWIPDELRIEKAPDPDINHLGKYLTELQASQIPHFADAAPPFTLNDYGGFRDQPGAWEDRLPRPPANLVTHDFGVKFRWYVRSYAAHAGAVARAMKAAAADLPDPPRIVAAGVTHCNLHYLMEMHRQDADAFAECDAIALHPYHWPAHDIYNAAFWTDRDYAEWRQTSPRAFAIHYMKNFDFLKVFGRLTSGEEPECFGLSGKRIWLTEFGIPTKKLGVYNSRHPQYQQFIYPRGMPRPDFIERKLAGAPSWEDLWSAFFDQVSQEDLEENNVEAIAIYTLRETAISAFDKHDDDRSNFALVKRSGLPRLAPEVFSRFRDFFTHGDKSLIDETTAMLVPDWGRRQFFSTEFLRSEPWRGEATPASVRDCLSMLTQDEKTFLYWAASEYFTNSGAVIDAGCFVGGSTVALAAGVAARWPDGGARVRSYDRFVTDAYMDDFYFRPNNLALNGESFEHVYRSNIEPVARYVDVNVGDICQTTWPREAAIELLFIDICKTWEVNDHVARAFFPSLVPGQSLVVQQDIFHHWCPWLAITMEILSDKFDFVAFVRWNSGVYRCRAAIAPEDVPADLRSLGVDALDGLMERHIGRYEDAYVRGVLCMARAVLLGSLDRIDAGGRVFDEAMAAYGGHPEVASAGRQVAHAFGWDGERARRGRGVTPCGGLLDF